MKKIALMISFLLVIVSCLPAAYAEEALTDAIVKEIIEYNLPGAVVAVQTQNTLAYLEAFGKSNSTLEERMETDTAIQTGSISRVFTAYALMQLLDEKGIDLGTSIEAYLPEDIKGKAAFSDLTFYNVLMHTTGIPSLKANSAIKTSPFDPPRLAFGQAASDFLGAYDHTRQMPADTYMMPSNVNSILAGVLIENLSGETFERYMANSVFRRIGMLDSAKLIGGAVPEKKAVNYNVFGGGLTEATPFKSKYIASDDLLTTGDDMAKFIAHQSAVLERLFSVKAQNTAGSIGRSAGFSMTDYKGLQIYIQDGGVPGANARLVFIPSHQFALFIYYNSDNLKAKDAIMDSVLAHYLPLDNSAEKREPYPHDGLEKFEGVYTPLNASMETVERLTHIIHQIRIQADSEGLLVDEKRFIPLSETVFFSPEDHQIIEFKTEADGKLSYLINGNQVYKHASVFQSFFIEALMLGFAFFINIVALLIVLIKWSDMKLHRVHDTPRYILLVHTVLTTVLMSLIVVVSMQYNYWDVIYDQTSSLVWIKWLGWLSLFLVIPTYLVLKRTKEDFRWSGGRRLIFNVQWVMGILIFIWLLRYQLV